MLVNRPQAAGGPFLRAFSGAFWRTGEALAGAGQGQVSVLTSRTVSRPLALTNTLLGPYVWPLHGVRNVWIAASCQCLPVASLRCGSRAATGLGTNPTESNC